MKFFIKRFLFIFFLSLFLCYCNFLIFKSILYSNTVIIPYSFTPFNICEKSPDLWNLIKFTYIIFCLLTQIIISNSISLKIFHKSKKLKHTINPSLDSSKFNLYLGKDYSSNENVFIPENGLFQNILVTGTIGSGKTSSFMYPVTKQLIEYNCNSPNKKLGLLILDVKGNYYKQVKQYAKDYNREDDLIIIELGGNIKYNPLHKPNLKPAVLANRLKTILTLFSPNNSESYWLDKAEQVLTECIKLCRLYNNGYVTFMEIHKLINIPNYYLEKISNLRSDFQKNIFSNEQIYDLKTALEFFENEFNSLDSRVLSILKSEITRITNTFISDYDIINTFSPPENLLNFTGFSKIISERKNCCFKYEYSRIQKFI